MKSPKKKKDYNAIESDPAQFEKFKYNFVMQALRRATYRWPFHHLAMKRQNRDYALYECENCHQCFGPKQINKDHIEPVIPVTGFKSWDEVINRMFVKSSQIQILCEAVCHPIKTNLENALRIKNGQKPLRTRKKKQK